MFLASLLLQTHTRTHTHTHKLTHIHTYTHTHAHTYIHTHTAPSTRSKLSIILYVSRNRLLRCVALPVCVHVCVCACVCVKDMMTECAHTHIYIIRTHTHYPLTTASHPFRPVAHYVFSTHAHARTHTREDTHIHTYTHTYTCTHKRKHS